MASSLSNDRAERHAVTRRPDLQSDMFASGTQPLRPADAAVFEFRRKLIRYPAFTKAVQAIERCHLYGRHLVEEPDCLLITGVSGAGKSTLRRTYAARYPRQEFEERTVIKVLELELPSAPTIKNVAERILMALGDPHADKGSAESRTARIITLFRECRVELAMLDEFQQFVDNAGGKIEYKVADWLKQLINATRVPFVLLGLPRCKRILEVNEQLRRRFLPQATLSPFSIKTKAEAIKFAEFLNTLHAQAPLRRPSAFIEPAVIPLMFYATNGLIDYLMKLTSNAIKIALEEERDCIDLDVLGRAFENAIWAQVDRERNPFDCNFIPRSLNKTGEPFSGYS
ncbi:TniB family protein [Cupriavidus sp. HMR-1]|uniref:TniB family NTP-binding protein n=1 Tax=Cupriavidus sp. HMR-1 TaxID=1249621 RepID=UPI0002A44286|nr:TniB family NTP-binding protein [Cupriavidus sp. HMR-1]EKZ97876.1 TniB family protein [Cupriavidus sp. HMR-1]